MPCAARNGFFFLGKKGSFRRAGSVAIGPEAAANRFIRRRACNGPRLARFASPAIWAAVAAATTRQSRRNIVFRAALFIACWPCGGGACPPTGLVRESKSRCRGRSVPTRTDSWRRPGAPPQGCIAAIIASWRRRQRRVPVRPDNSDASWGDFVAAARGKGDTRCSNDCRLRHACSPDRGHRSETRCDQLPLPDVSNESA